MSSSARDAIEKRIGEDDLEVFNRLERLGAHQTNTWIKICNIGIGGCLTLGDVRRAVENLKQIGLLKERTESTYDTVTLTARGVTVVG